MTDFIGFNTVDNIFPPYTLVDIDLVKRDILNEFGTRRGERVMQPEFGTIIFDLLMDPGDSITLSAIETDARRIVTNDPRVTLTELHVSDDESTVVIEIILTYTPEQMTETLYVTYNKNVDNDYL